MLPKSCSLVSKNVLLCRLLWATYKFNWTPCVFINTYSLKHCDLGKKGEQYLLWSGEEPTLGLAVMTGGVLAVMIKEGRMQWVARQRHPGACTSLERPRNIDTILPGKGGRSCSRQRSRSHNQREGETKTLVRMAKDSGKGISGLIQKPWGGVSVLLPPDCECIWLIRSTALNMSLRPL